jgi:hypothetical protein
VVIPVFNEEASLVILHRELDAALREVPGGVELIFVDDGSRDGSPKLLRDLERADSRLRVITLSRNCGQSAALDAGFQAVRGDVTVTLDGDLQNDPADIPLLLAELQRADLVNGVRTKRADSWTRRVSSQIANAVRNRVMGEHSLSSAHQALPRNAPLPPDPLAHGGGTGGGDSGLPSPAPLRRVEVWGGKPAVRGDCGFTGRELDETTGSTLRRVGRARRRHNLTADRRTGTLLNV